MAQGELLSTKLFCVFLSEKKIDHVFLPALDFMSIDANDEPELTKISERLTVWIKKNDTKKLLVTQGYICRNHRGEVDNLKRGGSDYTGTLIGAALRAEEIRRILSKINDEDMKLMGFDPKQARPEWMIITALAVAPPPVRPSVQAGDGVRSEDDLTYAYRMIVRTNNDLRRQME